MATRPKRRKRSTTSAEPTDSGDQPSPGIPQIDVEGMVQSCMSVITPTLEETFRQYMHNYHARGQVTGQQTTGTSTVVHQSTQQNEPSAAAGSEIIRPQPSLLQELTDSGNDFTPVPTSAISIYEWIITPFTSSQVSYNKVKTRW